ncbi:c-type cytochrome [Ascidiimonas sp. W6]|uniref:c-type cytochrome n=1 Tax=Ascidiimonas meishanensis TaxID=3128903 RepID=UPI0030ECD165
MKKLIVLGSSMLVAIMCSCGDKKEEKKGFEYNRTKEKTTTKENKKEVPVDLSNKGIGPIKEITFDAAINEEMASAGERLFKQKCTQCHLVNQRLIGPAMTGIYERRSPEWVMNIMLNPDEMLKKDPIAKALMAAYNNAIMLNQNLTQEEARSLAEYLRTL